MHPVHLLLTGIASVATALDIIAVAPSLPNHGTPAGQQTLVQHEFGNSWGSPATAQYSPPSFDFTHVQLELDLSSWGTQYDRLAHIYLNNVEIWRPSTPEPGNQNIYSNMTKDVSQYAALFKQSGTLTFELDNVQDSTYTGPFDCTLNAIFYNSGNTDQPESQWYYGDSLPDSVQALQSGTLVDVPPDATFNIPQVSKNTIRTGITVYATGNGDEEFWYTNNITASGPTRIIELYVNGQLAGLIDPFQPIYTGGMQPHLWYPIVGVNDFDIPSYYIDLSPFLPTLWNSGATLEFKINNGYNSNSVRSDWLVNVALMSWTDSSIEGTGGKVISTQNTTTTPIVLSSDTSQGFASYIGLSSSLTLTTELQFSDSSTKTVTWMQSSDARNAQLIGGGSDPQMYVSYQKGSSSFGDGTSKYTRVHEYPLGIYFGPDNAIGIDHSYIISNGGSPGVSSVNNNIRGSWGPGEFNETAAVCSWQDNGSNYGRSAKAVNNVLQYDSSGQTITYAGSWASGVDDLTSYAVSNNLNGLANALSQLATQYSQGYGQPSGQTGAQALNARLVGRSLISDTN